MLEHTLRELVRRIEKVMSALDALNTAVAQLTTDVAAATARVNALEQSIGTGVLVDPTELATAVTNIQAADTAINALVPAPAENPTVPAPTA